MSLQRAAAMLRVARPPRAILHPRRHPLAPARRPTSRSLATAASAPAEDLAAAARTTAAGPVLPPPPLGGIKSADDVAAQTARFAQMVRAFDFARIPPPSPATRVARGSRRVATPDTAAAPATGMFGDAALTSPDSMVASSRRMIGEATRLVDGLIARHAESRMLSADETRALIDDLDALSNYLCQLTDTAEFLRNVHPDRAWAGAADRVYADLSSLLHTLNTNAELYAVLRHAVDANVADLDDLEARNAAVFLRDFEQSGIHLPDAQRKKHVALSDAMTVHARDFFSFKFAPIAVPLTAAEAGTLPRAIRQHYTLPNHAPPEPNGAVLACDQGLASHLVHSSPLPSVREKALHVVHAAYPAQEANLQSLLTTRHELASLVGFPSFARMFLRDKMVNSQSRVLRFLDRLAGEMTPALDASFAALESLADSKPVQEWDRVYLQRQLEQRRGVPGELPTLATAMTVFAETVHAMYGVDLVTLPVANGEAWHPDVVKVAVRYQGTDLGTMYCDLVDRTPAKLAAAAHFTVRGRRIPHAAMPGQRDAGEPAPSGAAMQAALLTPNDAVQRPVVVLATSIRRGAPLAWTQVETLWHELGHATHSLLSFTHYQNVSGTRCALDVSEVPSILMELVLAHPAVQARFRAHQPAIAPCTTSPFLPTVKSSGVGSDVPRDMDLWSQVHLAAMDQVLHSSLISNHTPHALVTALRTDPASLPLLAPFPHLCAWLTRVPWHAAWAPHLRLQHLATYSGGYYSYLWSRVVALAVYERHLAGVRDLREFRHGGTRLWQEFLGWGGGRDPWTCVAGVLGVEGAARLRRYLDQ
ncbi:Mitochondrial intermediate peptidase [Blastocladiella emersonii ATCC 22665]|nr:Mitochondrial intermediate peptidase [Blastocladiella emersonii ATCC 22665]